MDKTNPFPVTRDNFSLCWEYIDTLRCKARKKAAVAAIAGFYGDLDDIYKKCHFIPPNSLSFLLRCIGKGRF